MEANVVAGDLAAAMQSGCLGARVAQLHRLVARAYERELQPLGISLPQFEILGRLMTAAGAVKPTALAAELMVERSTLSRNLALMQAKGWITGVKTSLTGRMMSVAIADPGVEVLAAAASGWARRQAVTESALGRSACSTLDHWIASLAEASADEAAAA